MRPLSKEQVADAVRERLLGLTRESGVLASLLHLTAEGLAVIGLTDQEPGLLKVDARSKDGLVVDCAPVLVAPHASVAEELNEQLQPELLRALAEGDEGAVQVRA